MHIPCSRRGLRAVTADPIDISTGKRRQFRRDLTIALALISLTMCIYGATARFGFCSYDDPDYVTGNVVVRRGLTAAGFIWAFTSTHVANWHPLTWLSHMLDVQLFGLDPAGHHLTSALLHAANAVLLYLALRSLTGAALKSAFVALLFAVHPLHVESVVWIAERKDVLSAFFWLMAVGVYGRYARRPAVVSYLCLIVCFTLGLLAKQMLVTLPFALLLLDYWPLGRLGGAAPPHSAGPLPRRQRLRFLLVEKIPLFALSGVFSVVVYITQQRWGAMAPLGAFPLPLRLENALVSYLRYLGKTVWPVDLAVFYPFPRDTLTPAVAVGAAVVLAALSCAAVAMRRRPAVPVGWFLFVGTLVPVIGLVQVGEQALADRYTYLPLIGLFIAATWGLPGPPAGKAGFARGRAVAGGAAVLLLAALAHVQLGLWSDDLRLFKHAIAVAPPNHVAHTMLGNRLLEAGRADEAMEHWREAIRIAPRYDLPYFNLGVAWDGLGDHLRAIDHYREAVRRNPRLAKGYYNMGLANEALGRRQEALAAYREAVRADPRYSEPHNNIGIVLAGLGRFAESIASFTEALRLDPGNTAARLNLERALGMHRERRQPTPETPR